MAKANLKTEEWIQEAVTLAAKVRGYFTDGDGKVNILAVCDGDRDLYDSASRLTDLVISPGKPKGR